MVPGKKTKPKVSGCTLGSKETNMRASGVAACAMGMALTSLGMAIATPVNTRVACRKDTASISGPMATITVVTSREASSRARESGGSSRQILQSLRSSTNSKVTIIMMRRMAMVNSRGRWATNTSESTSWTHVTAGELCSGSMAASTRDSGKKVSRRALVS